ncbi:MAG: divalent-cation tolerance protein CutA [Thermoproteota archaeon]
MLKRVSKILLERRLAGYIQIVRPVSSLYWWKGKMGEAREWLCIIKSRADLYEELERTIKENHSHAIPEIMAIRIVRASQDYLKWPENELKPR